MGAAERKDSTKQGGVKNLCKISKLFWMKECNHSAVTASTNTSYKVWKHFEAVDVNNKVQSNFTVGKILESFAINKEIFL